MKRLIIGVAAVGATCLLGCATGTNVAGFSSETSVPTRVAQNPDIGSGKDGPLIPGTVVADYEDTLIIRDKHGFDRAMRVDDQTLYRKQGGDIIAREYLTPGAQVRASFDDNNKERIAREVVIESVPTQCKVRSWPEEPSPYRRDP